MAALGVQSSASPFARAAPELIALGYNPLPIKPGEKRPGEYRGGAWQGMSQWERFRDRQPSQFELSLWMRNYPDANVGIVLGSEAVSPDGDVLHVIAVDIDCPDYEDFDAVFRALPHSPMRKKGAKGETLFYLAAKSIGSRPYTNKSGIRLVDLLTGFAARQTVCPPSAHPNGAVYAWTAGPIAATELPVFTAEDLEALEETLATLGWNAEAERAAPAPRHTPAAPIDEDDFFVETKRAALERLDAWVPALDLYGCHRSGPGYRSVASFRPSLSGKRMEDRNLHLAIHPTGIKDWGTDKGYSAIDLVMAARSVEQAEATSWLRAQLGLGDDGVTIALQPSDASDPGRIHHQTAGPLVSSEPSAPPTMDELPDALTRVPGLLGELTNWICDTSRRPQRGLALGAALTILGTAAGRKYAGPTRTATHLYILGLARTSAGKDHALQQIARVLTSCGMASHIGPSQFMSLPAVIKRLNRSPLTLCAMDEFGSFLARINNRRASPFEKAITGVLRTAWGSSFQTMAPPEWAGHDAEPIHSPALSIYGVSTPDEFYESLSGADVHNGFLNRFILISTRKRPAERDPKSDPFTVPQPIRDALHRVYGSGSAMAKATVHNGQADAPLISATWDSAEAQGAYVSFGRAVENREQDIAFLARSVEMAQRLATIRAIGIRPDAPRITLADMEWGRDLALWSAERMMSETADHLADTQNQAETQMIMRAIRERGRIKHGDLLLVMRHRAKAKDVKEMIQALADAGQITIESTRPAAGGTETRYYSPA